MERPTSNLVGRFTLETKMTHRRDTLVLSILLAIAVMFGNRVGSTAQSGNPNIVPPRPIKLVKPDCAEGKPCHGIHGEVTITVNVKTDGTVGDTYPKGTNQALMDAAEDAARQCKFEPGKFAGKPTSMNYDLHYKF
jgi:hypothetical protein